MEQTNTSLFSLSIDPVTKAHLSETARWARFLAIVGFIFLALLLIAGLFMVATMSTLTGSVDQDTQGFGRMAQYGVGIAAFFYIIMVVIAFFPLLFMLRFANKMKASLHRNDQQELNVSFQNLKSYFRFLGILMIIILAFYAILFLFQILGSSLM